MIYLNHCLIPRGFSQMHSCFHSGGRTVSRVPIFSSERDSLVRCPQKGAPAVLWDAVSSEVQNIHSLDPAAHILNTRCGLFLRTLKYRLSLSCTLAVGLRVILWSTSVTFFRSQPAEHLETAAWARMPSSCHLSPVYTVFTVLPPQRVFTFPNQTSFNS